jgi:hypothetical protein
MLLRRDLEILEPVSERRLTFETVEADSPPIELPERASPTDVIEESDPLNQLILGPPQASRSRQDRTLRLQR